MNTFLDDTPIPDGYEQRLSKLFEGLDEITEEDEPEFCVFDPNKYCTNCGRC